MLPAPPRYLQRIQSSSTLRSFRPCFLFCRRPSWCQIRSPRTWLEASVSCKTSTGLRIGNNLRGVLETTTSSQIWKGIIFNTAWPQQRSDLRRSFSFSLRNVHTNHPPIRAEVWFVFPGNLAWVSEVHSSPRNPAQNWLSFLVLFYFLSSFMNRSNTWNTPTRSAAT
jgi:hypothetical protein